MVEEACDESDVSGGRSDTDGTGDRLDAETAEESSGVGEPLSEDEWETPAGESDGEASDDACSKNATADGSDILDSLSE